MTHRIPLNQFMPVFLAVLFAFAFRAKAEKITVWQRWEHTLNSKKTYAQPYTEINVTVTFTGPGGESFSSNCFWQEGNTFIFRAAFPTPGKWTWQTSCSDKNNNALHYKKGKVTVFPYQGANPLFQNGFIKVSQDKRFLTYQNDQPFLWMGDTGWQAFRESTYSEWKKYIDDRAAKEFTIIQAHVSHFSGALPNVHGVMPFQNDIPNKAYWQDIEEKVEYANHKGLVILLVGLGVSGKKGYTPAMNTEAFAQYITGRMAGNFVIYSPSMDAPYDIRNDELGAYLKKADARHLVTQHVGTNLRAAEEFHPKPYLDFTAMQSGHHGGNVGAAYKAAHNWPFILWNKGPVKPVINSEGMYDGRGNNEGPNWREQDARRIGWISWLSGALGYTYGAGETERHVSGSKGGVWLFNKDGDSHDHWEKTLNWPSATHMTYLKKFFQGINWWELQPTPESIKNQPADPLNAMMASRSVAGDLCVAYLPDNDAIELSREGMANNLTGHWFSPVTNAYLPVQGKVDNKGTQVFSRPGEGDWVLLLNKK